MNSKRKIFVLSFEPLSSTLSNGRTLKNLLKDFSKDEIYNIYIHGEPDYDAATFYCISDKQALRSMFFLKPKLIIPKSHITETTYSDGSVFRRRSNFKLLVREYAWRSIRVKRLLLKLSKEINPDAIVTLLGNGGFMMKNAVYLANEMKIPLISYNCEDYYFKTMDYIAFKNKTSLIHKLYKKKFTKAFDHLMSKVSASIYLTGDLKMMFDERFPNVKSYVIYNSSELSDKSINQNINTKSKSFVYAGNIANGRLEELEKIGEFIKKIDSDFHLEVYTGESRLEYIEKLQNGKFITFKGSIDYQGLLDILKNAFAIIHVDSTEPIYSTYTIHGFSTKIPDSLSSGNCFIVRASKYSSVYTYIKQNNCAYCTDNDDELKMILEDVINNPTLRIKYINKAIEVVRANHSLSKNSHEFRKIVEEAILKHRS